MLTTWQTERPTLPLSGRWLLSLGSAAAVGATVAVLLLSALGFVAPTSRAEAQPEDSIARVYRQSLPGVVEVVDYSQLGQGPLKGALGSGFQVDVDGRVLTDHHVIDGVRELGVVLSDGSAYPADLVGDDPTHDLAVLKAPIPREKLHPLALADSSRLQVGQRVFAIGSPFGLEQTLTSGVVSYLGRRVEVPGKPAIEDAIQTDAAINPGNSGGPLLDTEGEVVGVSALAMLNSSGVAFAIPSSVARRLLPEMEHGDLKTRPWLGVTAEDQPSEARGGHASQAVAGAMLDVVLPGSPAAVAHLRGASYLQDPISGPTLQAPGDEVVAIDGVTVKSAGDLTSYMSNSSKQVGDEVRLSVVRDGRLLEVTVRLGARYDKQADLAGAI